jgi:tellurium resistance protein TerZ
MSVSSNKKTGINLSKGNSISLVKDEKLLEKICIGLNWGTIKKKSFLGLLKTTEPVDLDGSVTTFSKENKNLYTVYYQNLSSPDGAIKHSGDDREGDDSVDDLDNEVITIDLKKLNPDVEQIIFYLNSYEGQDFGKIPYVKIRIYEGTPTQVNDVFATFNLSSDESFKGKVSMVMGKLIRTKNDWEFKTIGDAVKSFRIKETIALIEEKYL